MEAPIAGPFRIMVVVWPHNLQRGAGSRAVRGCGAHRVVTWFSKQVTPVLTYFLEGNNGNYKLGPDDPLADQRIAAVRLFLYGKPVIVPTVRAEAKRIPNQAGLEEHLRFIDYSFGEFNSDEQQEASIQRRADDLLPRHSKGADDCRVLAEVEEDGDIPVLVTWDRGFIGDLAPYARVRLEPPVEGWRSFEIPPGTPPRWTPAPGHPLANEAWWRW